MRAFGCDEFMMCERGTTFGYNNLVVDMRSLYWMKQEGFPVVFDATHAVQKPGGLGGTTGGDSELAPVLASAAMATGSIDGVFMEVHKDPSKALSDGPNQIPLHLLEGVLKTPSVHPPGGSVMMKLLSTCFLTAALYGTEAQADTSLPVATPFAGVDKKLPMLELLPVGQVLPKVSLSRYEGPRLSMLLTASSVTVAAPQEIAANILNVYLYGKNNQTSHLFTQAASYFLDKKLAVSHTETTLREENLSAKGTGLYLDTNIKRGIILGPVQTTIRMAQRNK